MVKVLKNGKWGDLLFSPVLSLIFSSVIIFSIDILIGKESSFIFEKSIDVSLWSFGTLITFLAIIHQSNNEKINNLRSDPNRSINRLNVFNKRAVFISLICLILGFIYSYLILETPSFYFRNSKIMNFVFIFFWVWLISDIVYFLRVFYNLFTEKTN